jgi:hypothetical protein
MNADAQDSACAAGGTADCATAAQRMADTVSAESYGIAEKWVGGTDCADSLGWTPVVHTANAALYAWRDGTGSYDEFSSAVHQEAVGGQLIANCLST